MGYSIEKVTTLIGAHRYSVPMDDKDCLAGRKTGETMIAFLLTDSRSLSFPEETLFFALQSERNDGHRYIKDLYRRGVRSFVVETVPADLSEYAGADFLKVPSVLDSLQRLAERKRDEFNIPIVGITGSNGKTVVKEWLYQILMPQMHVTRSPRSYNSQIGVPLSVWKLHEGSSIGLFEAGISKVGEMERLREIIQPTIGVLTSLGNAHQENFSSLDEKYREKLKLFKEAGVVIYPADDVPQPVFDDAVAEKPKMMLGWSAKRPDAPFFVSSVEKNNKSTCVHYIYKGEEASYTIPFISEASIMNSITCATVARYLGITAEVLDERMKALEPVAMRLEVKEGRDGCTLINDSYNSDLASLDIALDFMNRRTTQLNLPEYSRNTVILSDIDQTGMSSSELYSEIAEMLSGRSVDKFIGIGRELKANAGVISVEEKYFFSDTDSFIRSDVFHDFHNEVVLIKGARRFGFDKITDLLVEKVHETTLEVNLTAMVENLNYYRSFMRKDTKLVCMIKADGYGAGAVEIAKTLQDHRVDYLAVAVADEGVALRKAGITANIMIMNPEMTAFKTMFDYDLEPEVYSFRLLDALRHAARKEGITSYPVHIKLDTGMHRLGFHPIDDVPAVVEYLNGQNALIPRSVFSHFVGSDDDGFDEFSAQQFKLYETGVETLQKGFKHHIIRHICNSAGIEHFPQRQMDMCRLGLGLYGVNPRDNSIINNVSTLKTTILQLRKVPAGDSIGYSRKTVLDRDSVIAAIPIGYADGLNRRLGNRNCYCLVNGKKAEYVGNICMDVCMIDVTDIDCKEGDSVEIFGDNLPVTVLSDTIGTIPYEILTDISMRVKRVYFQD